MIVSCGLLRLDLPPGVVLLRLDRRRAVYRFPVGSLVLCQRDAGPLPTFTNRTAPECASVRECRLSSPSLARRTADDRSVEWICSKNELPAVREAHANGHLAGGIDRYRVRCEVRDA